MDVGVVRSSDDSELSLPSRPQKLSARALYDNDPDCSDELAFCKGDILTILERNVPESHGWWRCLLHGRQGLAPANRLQILAEAPADRPWPPLLRGPEEALAGPEEVYQVPAPLSPSPPGPVYEHMKSWVERPPPPTIQVYEVPELPSGPRTVCEKVLRFPKQAVFTIPRPAQASSAPLPLYDVPVQSRGPRARKEPEEQHLYDIPARPRRAACGPPAGQPSRQSAPVTSTVALRRACYKTLPNPQKSEWIYDTPTSAGVRNASLTSSVDESGPCGPPRHTAYLHCPPNSSARSLTPHLHENVPKQKKLSLPEIPACHIPAPRDASPSDGSVSYKVPSSFLRPRVEQQNTIPNIYDIPKALSSAPRPGQELGKATPGAPEKDMDPPCARFSRKAPRSSPELDRLSVNSSDSRASVASSCSSTSTDSSCSLSSEESAKELPLDLDVAKGMVTVLQHKVASSIAGLMLFVSSKWRSRDYLEANIDAIRRAIDHIQDSLGEFLDFARGVCGASSHLTDSNLQARIRDQLQTISNSYQILLEAKGSLDGCHWSLDVLVTEKVQNSRDDLERFVLVARMLPEDIKRFASILIANGRLLFTQSCAKEGNAPLAPGADVELAERIRPPQSGGESQQRSAPLAGQRESEHCPELLKKNWTNLCENVPNLEEKVKPILEERLDENKVLETQNPSSPAAPLGRQDPKKKVHLSEHCRLYFGALFKAIGVFHGTLSHSQPPEIFIAQSKLVIMIGQKLVDTLCKETQDRDVRNEILCGGSHLCSLLKNLALATKNAVLKYPSPAALGHLQAEAEKLEQHTRQFRETLD
ncbi:cas scaffolding protein family member 4 isoform 1-T1 [Molossus nigricans]